MPGALSPSRSLSGGLLGQLPLVALLSRPLPRSAADQAKSRWIEALRTWCLVHWLDLASGTSGSNRYLKSVTDKLRLALDGDEDWLQLFLRLPGPTDSLTAMTQHLRSASGFASHDASGHLRPSHRDLLADLRNFCEGKAPPSTSGDAPSLGVFHRLPKYTLTSSERPLPALKDDAGTSTEPEAGAVTLNLDVPGDESMVLTCEVDETLTPAQQDRRAKGVLLATVEQYQYLRFRWEQPNPFEREALRRWIETNLASPDPQLRLLACGVWLAVQASTSLRTVMLLGVAEDSAQDWRVAPGSGRLHRMPPRRYNGWPAKGDAISWVLPLAPRIELPLPPTVHGVLRGLQEASPDAANIGELFKGADLEHRFRVHMQREPGLQRVTSGMLAHWQSQHLFEASLDPVFSQLVSSHPRSGLPGACAYASYPQESVIRSLGSCLGSADEGAEPPSTDPINGAGSELHPLETLLKTAFDDARAAVNRLALDPEKWIEHHNALITYSTLILLTVTAGRPVSSPFEDVSWIDLEGKRIFVRDKQASGGHTGRLLPLPAAATQFLQETLLPHLGRVATLLNGVDPELGTEVSKLASRQISERLPFLFLLSPDPQLAWVEVSESSLRAVGIFRWPLPWNLMRHRATTLLKSLGCDHEVINALMDHGEFGTGAYGPYSVRVWAADAEVAAPLVVQLLERLELGEIVHPSWPLSEAAPVPPTASGTALAREERYGLEARARRRSKTHEAMAAQVHREVAAFLNGRPFESVSSKQWDELLQSMLVQENRLPHAMGSARYDELLKWLRSQWRENGNGPRLKRRYSPQAEEPSHFTETAIAATRRLAAAREVLHMRLRNKRDGAFSFRDCLAWSTLSLMVDSRIADESVLRDALRGVNLRMVRLHGRLYLEYGPALDRLPDSPFKRYPLQEFAARLIDRTKSAKRKLDAGKEALNADMQAFAKAAGIGTTESLTVSGLISELAQIVGQANACELPGVLGGYLNGTVVSAALRHVDWIRCEKGVAAGGPPEGGAEVDFVHANGESLDDLDEGKGQLAPMASLSALVAPNTSSSVKERRTPKQQAAHELFKRARDKINNARGKAHSPRRDLDRELRELIATASDVAPSCSILVEWLRNVLWRKTANGYIELASVLRYFTALSPCFEAMAYEHDLRGCDSEEVTQFYQEVMDARIGGPEPGGSTESGGYQTWELALQLLHDFHQFARRKLSIEDPDWSEIDGPEDVLSISPGMLLEKEYHHAIKVLAPNPSRANREQVARAFILLCAFRFGLRGAEATGLLRRDWVEPQDGMVVVLVRNNQWRTLKTINGRRQVPLLFELSSQERQVIRRFFVLWESLSQGRDAQPLFIAGDGSDDLIDEKRLRADVNEVIKAVTLSPLLSLHHARHAFANRAGMLLFDETQELWPHAASSGSRLPSKSEIATRCSHARRLLQATEQVTRRSTWALGRLMGHAHPRTSLRSYVHFLPEWLARCIPFDADAQKIEDSEVLHVTDLDAWTVAPGYLQDVPAPSDEKAPPQPVNLERIFRLLRRFQDGVPLERAAEGAELELIDAACVVKAVSRIDLILQRRGAINRSLGGATNLLSHLPVKRWDALRAALTSRNVEIASGTWDVHAMEEVLAEMIGPSRQLLLWKRNHFMRFAQAMRHLELQASHFQFLWASSAHGKLIEWATEAGLDIPSEPSPTQPQVDSVQAGDPPVRIKHRLAVILNTGKSTWLESSYELVLVFGFVMMLMSLADHDPGDGSHRAKV